MLARFHAPRELRERVGKAEALSALMMPSISLCASIAERERKLLRNKLFKLL
jgi:hypothetical protein